MKSKFKTKISLAIIALVLLITTPIMLAGCAANISIGGGFGVMRKAAHNYFDTRTDYENYADTTISSTLGFKTYAQEKELTYNKKGRQVTEKFKDSMDLEATRTLYVKNIANGDDKYVAIVLKLNATTTTKEYYVAEQESQTPGEITRTLATITETSTEVTTYTLTPIIADTGITFGLYKNTTRVETYADDARPEDNDDPNVNMTKEYRTYPEDDYVELVNEILHRMNDKVIIDSFFSILDEDNDNKFATFAQYELDGNNLRVFTGNLEFFTIDDDTYKVADHDGSLEIKYTGNKVDSYAMSVKGELGQGLDMEMSAKVTVKDSAKVDININEEDFVLNRELIIAQGDFPSNAIFDID